jgi:Protein of unknown function (DUF2946)
VSISGLQQRRTWRQLTSCLIAYAFALQLVLLGFAAPRIAALAADQDALSAGLCLHDQGAPSAPVDNSGGDEHCKFCTAAAHQVFTAPSIPHHLVVRAADAAVQPATDQYVARPPAHASQQPRGPPRTA